MGLSLGSIVETVLTGGLSTQADLAGDVLGVQNPRTTAITAGISSIFGPEAGALASSFGTALQDDGGTVYDDSGNVYGQGGVIPTAGSIPAIGAMVSSVVVAAIARLSQVLGGARISSMGGVLSYGRRVYAQLAGWATKNPGVSLVAMLVSLGLTAEQAAHFLAWGATHKRRRRGRGISAAQLRTTRRTMRKIIRMYHSLPHSSSRSRRFGGAGGATIVQAR